MGIVMAYWDCGSCGRKGNPGSDKYCPGCGAPRGADVEFYIDPERASRVDTEAEADVRKRGADRPCDFCGGLNRGDAEYCTGCGAPLDKFSPDYLELKARRDAGEKAKEAELIEPPEPFINFFQRILLLLKQ